MKVHLCYPDGSIYCGSKQGSETPVQHQLAGVTCLRCLRRYYRLPINAEVPKHLIQARREPGRSE